MPIYTPSIRISSSPVRNPSLKKNRSTPPPTDVSGSDRTTSARRRHPTRRRHVSPRDQIAAATDAGPRPSAGPRGPSRRPAAFAASPPPSSPATATAAARHSRPDHRAPRRLRPVVAAPARRPRRRVPRRLRRLLAAPLSPAEAPAASPLPGEPRASPVILGVRAPASSDPDPRVNSKP